MGQRFTKGLLMYVETELLDLFVQFMRGHFGIIITLHTKVTQTGEYGRFLLGSSFFVIRDPAQDHVAGTVVEVHSSNVTDLRQVSDEWYQYLAFAMKDGEDDDESDEESNNGRDG